MDAEESKRRTAWALSIAGLLPFLFLSLALVALGGQHPMAAFLADALKAYAAIILSFLGGIRWGMAIRMPDAAGTLIISIMPALVGWAALFVADSTGLLILAVAFALHALWDWRAGDAAEMPDWFATMRLWIGLAVTVLLALAAFAV